MSLRLVAPLFFALTTLVSALAYPRMPARVPVHWNLHGDADRFGSRWELLLLGPGLTLVFGALFVVLERIDPKVRSAEDDPSPRRAVFGIALALVAAMHVVILGHVAGSLHDMNRSMSLVMAAFLVVCGNVMTRVRPNWFAGIRTPWTLSNDEVWRRTHRFGGHAMFAAGLVAIVVALTAPSPVALAATIALMLASTLAPAVYSYVLYKRLSAAG